MASVDSDEQFGNVIIDVTDVTCAIAAAAAARTYLHVRHGEWFICFVCV